VPDAEVGFIVGLAAAIQIPAAFVGGALVDRFGPIRLLGAGAAAYLFAVLVLLMPSTDSGASLTPFVVARMAQGIGFGLTRPAWLSLLPRIVSSGRSGLGLGIALTAQNISLIVMPPLSLAILGGSSSLDGVAGLVGCLVVLGTLSLLTTTDHLNSSAEDVDERPPRRWYGFTYRTSWTPVLAIQVFYLVHWGSLTAYLPQQAEAAGADVGLFFMADGLLSLAARLPSGWLADRVKSRWLVLAGLILTGGAVSLLILPMSTVSMIAAGAMTGTGVGLITTPIYVELTRLSSPAERGSAFAMVSVAAAVAIMLGSIGVAPIIGVAGFETAILISLGGIAIAAVITLVNRRLDSVVPSDGASNA
jgi:MFS family permease